MILALFAGCRYVGLEPMIETIPEDASDSSAIEPVDVGLAGRTWGVDLREITPVEPPGLLALVDTMDSPWLLFHVFDEEEDAHTLTLLATIGTPEGAQDPCQAIQQLPPADFSTDPVFSIERGTLDLALGGSPVRLHEAWVSATVAADASAWEEGTLQGTVDVRDFEETLGSADAVCAFVEGLDGLCRTCPDGAIACVDVAVEDVTGEEVAGAFDSAPATEGCE